jgi:hypothetical protein
MARLALGVWAATGVEHGERTIGMLVGGLVANPVSMCKSSEPARKCGLLLLAFRTKPSLEGAASPVAVKFGENIIVSRPTCVLCCLCAGCHRQ